MIACRHTETLPGFAEDEVQEMPSGHDFDGLPRRGKMLQITSHDVIGRCRHCTLKKNVVIRIDAGSNRSSRRGAPRRESQKPGKMGERGRQAMAGFTLARSCPYRSMTPVLAIVRLVAAASQGAALTPLERVLHASPPGRAAPFYFTRGTRVGGQDECKIGIDKRADA